ncbi:MAG TPA: oxygen-insensitive NADPH nitroreductase [Gammaproteobacteria bacterium]|nr:oxygen-insensitive NADPH nitroreductase [Gammaproteobacteria bacterium]
MQVDNYSPVMNQQHEHCSIRHFTDESIPADLLDSIFQSGQCAASSSFIQAYSIVRVTRNSVRNEIADAAGGQIWVEKAPEFMIFCADLYRVNEACKGAGIGEMEGYAEHFLAAVVDVALVAQNVVLAAESVGLGGVFIGGIRNDPQRVSDLLELPDHVFPVFGLCLGWPEKSCQKKPRLPLSTIVHTDVYHTASVRQDLDDYDALMAEYYKTRESNQKHSNWSEETARAVQGKKREHMLAFLQQRGFLKR